MSDFVIPGEGKLRRQTYTIALESGILRLELKPGRVPIRRLLGFASRIGSKRQFLLVSKVLGKHYPVSPLVMSWSYRALARSVLAAGCGPRLLWIGMAETATGLGYGIFEAASRELSNPGLFLQTTRYHMEGVPRLEFDEAHSHATDLYLYYPPKESGIDQFVNADTLILIDDEISTGRTFARLIGAYRAVNPRLSRVMIVSLVNFASHADRFKLEAEAGVPVHWIALREGTLSFENGIAEVKALPINAVGDGACKKHLLAWPGRTGIKGPIRLQDDDIHALTKRLGMPGAPPLLVLGSGECNAPAFLLGRELERRGYRVKVQSTTRSPIRLGNDIASVCRFQDNYADGIDNYLYNLDQGRYCKILLCHETPPDGPLKDRLDAWSALGIRFAIDDKTGHAKIYFS